MFGGWFDPIILALATWRIGCLIQWDRGPFAVFARCRRLFGIEHDEDGHPSAWPDSEIGRLLQCHYCGSLWVGAGLVGCYLWQAGPTVWLALPFALSAASIALEGVISYGKS